jgi:ubiquitin-protein ligase
MYTMSLTRLTRDYQDILQNPIYLWETYPNESDIYTWTAILSGHPESPYAGKSFSAKILFTEKYPFEPPQVKFTSHLEHPNVSPLGIVCADILKGPAWSPAYTVSTLLLSIGSLIFETPLVRSAPESIGQ